MAKLVKTTRFVSEISNEIIADEWTKATHNSGQDEIQKCKASPYYFYTHYFIINGKPATTVLTEEEFNIRFNKYFL